MWKIHMGGKKKKKVNNTNVRMDHRFSSDCQSIIGCRNWEAYGIGDRWVRVCTARRRTDWCRPSSATDGVRVRSVNNNKTVMSITRLYINREQKTTVGTPWNNWVLLTTIITRCRVEHKIALSWVYIFIHSYTYDVILRRGLQWQDALQLVYVFNGQL